jgi:hypothetical protein
MAKVTRFSRPSACVSRECTASLSIAIFLPLVSFAALGLLEWCRHNYWFAYLNQRGFTVVQDHVKNDCKIYTLCTRIWQVNVSPLICNHVKAPHSKKSW